MTNKDEFTDEKRLDMAINLTHYFDRVREAIEPDCWELLLHEYCHYGFDTIEAAKVMAGWSKDPEDYTLLYGGIIEIALDYMETLKTLEAEAYVSLDACKRTIATQKKEIRRLKKKLKKLRKK